MPIPIVAAVLETANEFAFCPPILNKGESPTTPKHNYKERFDCPVLTAGIARRIHIRSLVRNGYSVKISRVKKITTKKFEQYMFIPFWNWLCTLPSVKMKLQLEVESPLHLIAAPHRALRPNTARQLREWKCCFSIQYPKRLVPPRKAHPTFKLNEFDRHLLKIWRYTWLLKRDLAGNEQTMEFKWQHIKKLQITYKDEGDGFQ